MKKIYSITQIINYLKEYLAEEGFFDGLWLRGELSGYKCHQSGHCYFSLRDETSSLRCVMFRSYAVNLEFMPEDGMDVLVWGRLSVYEKDGTCQLYAQELFPAGAGAQSLALEQLKKALAAEGLFDTARKRSLPLLPKAVAVVTSPQGAAWADIQKIAQSRWPAVKLLLFPAVVQGYNAALSLTAAIRKAGMSGAEVMIVGRGGGANEDLSAFDNEDVVREIAASPIPVISAVGHEIDFSLSDLVADQRAATPSHAAALAVPEIRELVSSLDAYRYRLCQALERKINEQRLRLESLTARDTFSRPQLLLDKRKEWLDTFSSVLNQTAGLSIRDKERRLAQGAARLSLLDPLATLSRGYAVCSNKDGAIINDAAMVKSGDKVGVRLAKGSLDCIVKARREESGKA